MCFLILTALCEVKTPLKKQRIESHFQCGMQEIKATPEGAGVK